MNLLNNQRAVVMTPLSTEEIIGQLQRSLENGEGGISIENVFAPDWTPPDPICNKVSSLLFEMNPNLFAPNAFPTVATCLDGALKFLAETFAQPAPCGQIVSGSTEGLLNAMEAACRHFGSRAIRVIAPVSAHLSVRKVLRYRGIPDELVKWIDVDQRCQPDINAVVSAVDGKDPCFVFTTAGTVDFGTVDPVRQIAETVADRDVWLHIDAASAGMVLPFLPHGQDSHHSDFSIPGVKSLSVDIHKRGLAPLPCSFVLFRDPADLEMLCEVAPYTGCLGSRPGFTGSFPGISAAWAWSLFNKYGRDGYAQIATDGMAMRKLIVDALTDHGIDVFTETRIPLVVIPFDDAALVADEILAKHGIWVESSIRPCGKSCELLRIGIMPHNTIEGTTRLIDVLTNALK